MRVKKTLKRIFGVILILVTLGCVVFGLVHNNITPIAVVYLFVRFGLPMISKPVR